MTIKMITKIFITLSVCLLLSSCGTVMTLSSNESEFPQNRKYVYAGVRTDASAAFGSETDNFLPIWLRGLIAVDIPFSAVADTVCLPYTITKALAEKNKINTPN